MDMLQKYPLLMGLVVCIATFASAQTTLYPGDIALLGVNTSNSNCSGSNSEDLISFVCFKALTPGTTIDITDNGWERLNAGAFGNSEGIVRIERTMTTLPAGTVITLRTQGVGGDYEIIAPDNNWTFTRLNTLGNNLNLNAGGDQLIFLQGGDWFDGTSSGFGGFSHDATYTNGRFLMAFNSLDTWDAFADNSQQSGLPADLANCFNQISTGPGADFLAYTGPTDAASSVDWYKRLQDNQNWQSFADCSNYPTPPININLLSNAIGLDCKECGSCEAYEETMYFRLPTAGGPFTVVYTQNQDTLTATGVLHNDSITTMINTATTMQILSLTDTDGCTFSPPTENGFEALIEPLSYSFQRNGSACDTACYTIDFTFAGNGPFLLRYYFSHQDSSEARTFISLTDQRSLDICPQDLPTDQGNIELVLLSLKDLNCTIPLTDRIEVASGGIKVTDIAETICEGEFREVNGTIYDMNNPSGQEIIPGGAANGCDSIINVTLTFTTPLGGNLSGDATLCEGESTMLTLNLEGAASYTVEIQDDQAGLIFLNDVQNGEQIEVSPSQTTTYTLVSVSAGSSTCTAAPDQSVTVAVSNFDLQLAALSDYAGYEISCAEASDGVLEAQVEGASGSLDFSWSNGATTAIIRDLAPGNYQVSVSDGGGCTQTGSYQISAPPALQLQLGRDSSGCGGASTALQIDQIQGGTGPYEYSLDGQSFTAINSFPFTSTDLEPGNYELTIQDMNDCQLNSNFSIGSNNNLAFDLGQDFSILSGDSTIISVEPVEPPLEINWINTEMATFLAPLEISVKPQRTQTYGLQLTYADGCTVEDYITVFVEQRADYYAPTGFSPNEDGVNDQFTIFGGSQISGISYLRVFSRWGQLLFEAENLGPNEPFRGWDGTYRNEPAASGTYLFSAELTYRDGRTEVISGDFVLLR